jgi:hypothetical protein
MPDELEKSFKGKDKPEKVYLSMWMEGTNVKLTSKRNETKFQINITPKDGEIYHLLKALWDYEANLS